MSMVLLTSAMIACACGDGTPVQSPAPLVAERLLERMCSPRPREIIPGPGAIPECIKAPAEGAPGWADYQNQPFNIFAQTEDPQLCAACFDPNDPPSWEVQQAIENIVRSALADRFVLNNSWPGNDNAPIALTWSLVADGTSIPGSPTIAEPTSPSILFSTMDSRFGSGNRAAWIGLFQSCFNRWSSLTGVSYTFVRNNGNDWDDGASFPSSPGSNTPGATRGDIRIACHLIDGSGRVLAYNYYPSGGDMVLDASETWNFGAPNYTFLRNTVMHEHGHGLGLAHVCPADSTKLMEPFITSTFDGPQHDDIRAAQYNYGDKFEPNNTRAAAASIGALTAGATLSPSAPPAPAVTNGSLTGVSLSGDEDWYVFTTTTPLIGTITLTPLGSNYADYVQDASCNNPVVNVNSQSIADMTLEFVGGTGTLIATANSTGFGGTETLNNILLSPPGNLYVHVHPNNSPTETQLYSLTLSAASAPVLDASDGAFTNRVRLSWPPLSGVTAYGVYRSTTNNRAAASLINTPTGSSSFFDDFTAVFGTTYYYWLEANTGGGGLRAFCGPDTGFIGSANAPANDVCANAIAVAKGSVVSGTLTGASNDATATCGSSSSNADVWYTFTAACAGTLSVSTCGTNDTGGTDLGIDTVLSLWSGCPNAGGVELVCNDTAFNGQCDGIDVGLPRDAALARVMAAGESVRIRVSKAASSAVGAFTLRVGFTVPGDSCASPITISPAAAIAFCNALASTDGPAEPACFTTNGGQISNDLWYSYTPVTTGRFTVRTCGSTFDTRLAAYTSCAGPNIVCNDDAAVCGAGSLQSSISTFGVAGATYLLRVGSASVATGSGQVRVYCAADFNLSGESTLQDIFDFLSAYFANDPLADFNGSGSATVQDLFDFLMAWFGGC